MPRFEFFSFCLNMLIWGRVLRQNDTKSFEQPGGFGNDLTWLKFCIHAPLENIMQVPFLFSFFNLDIFSWGRVFYFYFSFFNRDIFCQTSFLVFFSFFNLDNFCLGTSFLLFFLFFQSRYFSSVNEPFTFFLFFFNLDIFAWGRAFY